VLGEQAFPHGDTIENCIEDEATHSAAFRLGTAPDLLRFLFCAAYE
jgi:hypothetical protein